LPSVLKRREEKRKTEEQGGEEKGKLPLGGVSDKKTNPTYYEIPYKYLEAMSNMGLHSPGTITSVQNKKSVLISLETPKLSLFATFLVVRSDQSNRFLRARFNTAFEWLGMAVYLGVIGDFSS
jgi:hypothetical protein